MLINKKTFLYGALFLAGQLCFIQCNFDKNNSSNNGNSGTDNKIPGAATNVNLSIKPAFEGVDVPFQKYVVNCKQGKKINIEKTGTVIEIPADAFVDANGQAIKGEVEISFREFHDAADIIASGIPMQNPETGEYMETAGMFEIKGNCAGKEVFIKEGKNVNVQLASYNPGNRFDFFQLDPNKGSWTTKQEKGEPVINLQRAQELKKLVNEAPQKPVAPLKFGNTDKFVFDLNVDYKRYPELSMFKDVIWQFAGNKNDKDNPENNPEAFSTDWTSIDLKKNADNYSILLKTNNKSFEMRVLPVLKGNDYTKAMADFDKKMGNFEKAKEALTQRQEMYERQAELQRSYALSGFGIYNWDFWKGDNRQQLEASIDFDAEFDYAENLSSVDIFLVNNDRKAVVRYSIANMKNFVYPKGDQNRLIAVLPGNKVACFTEADFAALEKNKNFAKGEKVTLRMKTADIKINSVADISSILAMN